MGVRKGEGALKAELEEVSRKMPLLSGRFSRSMVCRW